MAIQKVSDLPILRKNDLSVEYSNVKASLIELSYKVSSDMLNGVSRYQSKAITVGEFADYILSAQNDGGVFGGDVMFPNGFKLSGSVYFNQNVPDGEAQRYIVDAKTGVADIKAVVRYQLSSQSIEMGCESFAVKNQNRTAVEISDQKITVGAETKFNGPVTVPAITRTSSPAAPVNYGYLTSVMPSVKSPFLLFETKYLDYDNPALSADGWINTANGAWLLSSDFPNAYNHLRDDWNGVTDSIIIKYPGANNIEIQAKKAKDGHIVCLATQADKVNQLAQALGVAWVYVVDETNKRFILPRNSKFMRGCKNSADAGGYNPPAYPEHTHYATASVKTLTAGGPGGACNGVLTVCQNHGSQYTLPVSMVKAGSGSDVMPASINMNLFMYCS